MNLGEKLQVLRKQFGYSQEELGERLGISRQAVSKWESNQSTPDLNKIIMLSELYGVTIDSLLKEQDDININQSDIKKEEEKNDDISEYNIKLTFKNSKLEYEYKSKKELFGMPLIHVKFGRRAKAKGIIAVGNSAFGVISIGMLSMGIISFGMLSVGLVSIGLLALGILLAIGTIAVGTIAIGAISIGIYSLGALAIGKYSVGAAAIASDVAVGDYARAHVAIGRNVNGDITKFVDSSWRREFSNINKFDIQAVIKSGISDVSNFTLKWLTFIFK